MCEDAHWSLGGCHSSYSLSPVVLLMLSVADVVSDCNIRMSYHFSAQEQTDKFVSDVTCVRSYLDSLMMACANIENDRL